MKLKFYFYQLAIFSTAIFARANVTNNLTALDYNTVSNAVALANPGDIVKMPAGSVSWSNAIITRGVSVVGSGLGNTIIFNCSTNETLGGHGGGLFKLFCGDSRHAGTNYNLITQVSDFSIIGDTNFGFQNSDVFPVIEITEDNIGANGVYNTSNTFLLKNILMFDPPHMAIYCGSGTPGVISHCNFQLQGAGVRVDGARLNMLGMEEWALPQNLGTTNAVVVEDCVFNAYGAPLSCYAMDGWSGCRQVFRDNMVTNMAWSNHGLETAGYYAGGRTFEIYNNQFVCNSNAYVSINVRSGSGVIYSNEVRGYQIPVVMAANCDRAFCSYLPWGGANGVNPWDSNSPAITYFTNTISQTGAVTQASSTWTVNQWLGYTVYATNSLAGSYLTNSGNFGQVISNNANTLFLHQPQVSQTDIGQRYFTNGQICSLRLVWPILEQPGWGQHDLILYSNSNYNPYNSTTGIASYAHPVHEGIYLWGNTAFGANYNGVQNDPNIIIGSDIIVGVKTNYTPLVYPHPLANGYAFTFIPPTNGTPTNAAVGVKISALPVAGTISDGDIFAVVQNTGTNLQTRAVTAVQLKSYSAGSPITAANFLLSQAPVSITTNTVFCITDSGSPMIDGFYTNYISFTNFSAQFGSGSIFSWSNKSNAYIGCLNGNWRFSTTDSNCIYGYAILQGNTNPCGNIFGELNTAPPAGFSYPAMKVWFAATANTSTNATTAQIYSDLISNKIGASGFTGYGASPFSGSGVGLFNLQSSRLIPTVLTANTFNMGFSQFGDSILNGYLASTNIWTALTNYLNPIVASLGIPIIAEQNNAVNGSIFNYQSSQLTANLYRPIYVFQGGINDLRYGVTNNFGATSDAALIGAYTNAIGKVIATGGQQKTIVILTVPQWCSFNQFTNAIGQNYTNPQNSSVIYTAANCEQYDYPTFLKRCYNVRQAQLNMVTNTAAKVIVVDLQSRPIEKNLVDGLHPNTQGQAMICDLFLTSFINGYCPPVIQGFGVSTNVVVGLQTFFITNGIIGKIQ